MVHADAPGSIPQNGRANACSRSAISSQGASHSMSTAAHPPIHPTDYTVPAFLIPTVDLDVAVFEDYTRVSSRITLRHNAASADRNAPLVLDGQELTLESVALNGR